MAAAGLILPNIRLSKAMIQPASLDLRLGDIAYRLRADFPARAWCDGVRAHRRLKLHENISLRRAVLRRIAVYIVPAAGKSCAAA